MPIRVGVAGSTEFVRTDYREFLRQLGAKHK
jgi:hypothetical protein